MFFDNKKTKMEIEIEKKKFNGARTFSGVTLWRGPIDRNGLHGDDHLDDTVFPRRIDLSNIDMNHNMSGDEKVIRGGEFLYRSYMKKKLHPSAVEQMVIQYKIAEKKSKLGTTFLDAIFDEAHERFEKDVVLEFPMPLFLRMSDLRIPFLLRIERSATRMIFCVFVGIDQPRTQKVIMVNFKE